jgi:DNA modification methylase
MAAMTPALLHANSLRMPVASNSVHCVVTSPPYWGLRKYSGTQSLVWGGEEGCAHEWGDEKIVATGRNDGDRARLSQGSYDGGGEDKYYVGKQTASQGAFCLRCGAWYGELGLEPTPELYIEHMVEIFREVRRVLHPSGVIFVNMGDSYNGSGGAGGDYNEGGLKEGQPRYPGRNVGTLKPKDLVGIPWMLAFALREDGWWLRSDIIWSKPNPMPESVTDRPTKAHEYLFLLTKSKQYYYDADAVREGNTIYTRKAGGYNNHHEQGASRFPGKGGFGDSDVTTVGRNKRTVWTITTHSFKGAHFATFPPALVEPCIKAGSSEHGVCPRCRNPWRRVVERTNKSTYQERKEGGKGFDKFENIGARSQQAPSGKGVTTYLPPRANKTLGWQPTCDHDLEPVPAVVLDPFVGSGTTCMEARKLGRNSVGLDLSYPYLQLAKDRLGLTALEQWEQGKDGTTTFEDLPMFERR